MTWPKSLATLAVIEPDWPLVRSFITTWKPADVSCKSTVRVSPDCIIRSLLGSGVKVARVEWIGRRLGHAAAGDEREVDRLDADSAQASQVVGHSCVLVTVERVDVQRGAPLAWITAVTGRPFNPA